MTGRKNEQTELFTPFNPWLAPMRPLVETSLKLTDTLFTRAFAVASELTDFTLLRVEEDVRLPERLTHCRSPQDVQQAWADYWKKAFEQYQGEWGRLAKINGTAIAFPEWRDEAPKTRAAA